MTQPATHDRFTRLLRFCLLTAAVNTALTAALYPLLNNEFLDLLVSIQVLGFTLIALLWPALTRPMTRVQRVLSVLGALAFGPVLGLVFIMLVKGRDLMLLFSQEERMWSGAFTAGIGFFFGILFTVIWTTRARIARAEAELMRSEAERQILARQHAEAELAVVRAQIEPHFLFNTLANLRFLIKDDPKLALAMLDNLIDYLQAAVPRIRGQSNALRDELAMASSYVSILQIRMGDRLQASFDVSQDLLGLPFPPMMLITLIENAIKHGLNELQEGGHLHVHAERRNGRLRVSVADTGIGLAPEASLRDGVGLSNIRERLQAMYGDMAHLELAPNPPRGTIATIDLPLTEAA
jgi:signal transduction histidine kinase